MMAAKQWQPLRLAALLEGLAALPPEADRAVEGLCLDSRKLRPGEVFVALKGATRDAAAFIDAAIDAGARAVLRESAGREPRLTWRENAAGERIPLLALPALAGRLGTLADRFHGEPSKYLSITGITGTNGKTSVSQYLAQCLGGRGPCGVMGTLGAGILNGTAGGELEQTGHTTPDVLRCHQWLAQMRERGVREISMEVSSHALEQGRVNGIRFDCAVFTNLSRDHLDYHGDMDSYARAKAGLFAMPGLKQAVINVDDARGRELAASLPAGLGLLRYGLDARHDPDVLGRDLRLDAQGLSMRVQTPWGSAPLRLPLLGRFNAANALAVLAVLGWKGWNLKQIIACLQRLRPVAGRMQRLGGDGLPLVVVDYAHTPDALAQALSSVREHAGRGRLWCVFGCGGDRDRGKRALMGEAAARLADRVLLTSDNPRGEDPRAIIDDIREAVATERLAAVEPERAAAIALAINEARPEDVILIAGKGHEDYQIIGAERRPFSDLAEARACLQRRRART